MLPLLLLFAMTGDYTQFLASLKRNPPACAEPLVNLPVNRPAVWNEHYGPRLVSDRSVQLAPGIAVIFGTILEVGPPFGIRHRPIRIVAVQRGENWQVHHSDCGAEPPSWVITRLTQ